MDNITDSKAQVPQEVKDFYADKKSNLENLDDQNPRRWGQDAESFKKVTGSRYVHLTEKNGRNIFTHFLIQTEQPWERKYGIFGRKLIKNTF